MKIELSEDCRSLIDDYLEDGYNYIDDNEEFREAIYEIYLQFSAELNNNEKESLQMFQGLSEDENQEPTTGDDLAKLFKLIYLYDSELDGSQGYQYGEIPFLLMEPYMEEQVDSNLIFQSLPKFKQAIPLWIFKYSIFAFEQIDGLPLNDFIQTFFVFLRHFDRRFWTNAELCPEWTDFQEEVFVRFIKNLKKRMCGHNSEPSIRPTKQFDDLELIKLIYEHIKTPFMELLQVLASFKEPFNKIMIQEFEKLKVMEKSEERSKKFEKALQLIVAADIQASFITELFVIVGDESERLEVRELAIRSTLNYSFNILSTQVMCLKCCSSQFPTVISQQAFNKCTTTTNEDVCHPDAMSFQDFDEFKKLLLEALINYKVENLENAIYLFKFVHLYRDYLNFTDDNEIISIYYLLKPLKYIHEIKYPDDSWVVNMLKFINSQMILHPKSLSNIFSKYFEEIRKMAKPSRKIAKQLLKNYLHITSRFTQLSQIETFKTLSKDIILYVYDNHFKDSSYIPDGLTSLIISKRLYNLFPEPESNLEFLFHGCFNTYAFDLDVVDGINVLSQMFLTGLTKSIRGKEALIKMLFTSAGEGFELELAGILNLIDRDCAFEYISELLSKVDAPLFYSTDSLTEEYSQAVALYGYLSLVDDYLDNGDKANMLILRWNIGEHLKRNPLIDLYYKRVTRKEVL